MAEQDPLLREVNDALRQERMQNAWKRYRFPLFGVIALLIAITAGVSISKHLSQQAAGAYTEAFMEAKRAYDTTQYAEASEAFDALASEHHGARQAMAVLWHARALRAGNMPAKADAVLRSYVEQAREQSLWRDMACVQLLASESLPDACNGASNSPLASVLRTQAASELALKGQWSEARALLALVKDDENAPRELVANAELWQETMRLQQSKAAMAITAQEALK